MTTIGAHTCKNCYQGQMVDTPRGTNSRCTKCAQTVAKISTDAFSKLSISPDRPLGAPAPAALPQAQQPAPSFQVGKPTDVSGFFSSQQKKILLQLTDPSTSRVKEDYIIALPLTNNTPHHSINYTLYQCYMVHQGQLKAVCAKQTEGGQYEWTSATHYVKISNPDDYFVFGPNQQPVNDQTKDQHTALSESYSSLEELVKNTSGQLLTIFKDYADPLAKLGGLLGPSRPFYHPPSSTAPLPRVLPSVSVAPSAPPVVVAPATLPAPSAPVVAAPLAPPKLAPGQPPLAPQEKVQGPSLILQKTYTKEEVGNKEPEGLLKGLAPYHAIAIPAVFYPNVYDLYFKGPDEDMLFSVTCETVIPKEGSPYVKLKMGSDYFEFQKPVHKSMNFSYPSLEEALSDYARYQTIKTITHLNVKSPEFKEWSYPHEPGRSASHNKSPELATRFYLSDVPDQQNETTFVMYYPKELSQLDVRNLPFYKERVNVEYNSLGFPNRVRFTNEKNETLGWLPFWPDAKKTLGPKPSKENLANLLIERRGLLMYLGRTKEPDIHQSK